MIKANDRDLLRTADGDRFPTDLIRIARFDEIGAFALQDFLDDAQVQKCPIAGAVICSLGRAFVC